MPEDINLLKKRFRKLSEPVDQKPTGTKPVLKKMNGIRYVIFDFYGTLFISGVGDIGIDEESRNESEFRDALKAAGYETSAEAATEGFDIYEQTVNKHKQSWITKGYEEPEPAIEDVWLDVLNELHLRKQIRKKPEMGDARLFSVEFEARMNPVWPMPNLLPMLKQLQAGGLEIGIISNSQFYTPIAFEALTDKELHHLGFNPGLLHWSYEEHLKKPSVEFYSRFMEKLKRQFPDASPEQVLYIGNDMLKDVYPAAKLGMKTALFAGDQRSLKWRREDPRCKKLQPDLVVTDLLQIVDCI